MELTGMVTVMQGITKMQLVYFKTEGCPAGPGRELYGRAHLTGGVLCNPERLKGSVRASNRYPSNEAKPQNGVAAAFIPKGFLADDICGDITPHAPLLEVRDDAFDIMLQAMSVGESANQHVPAHNSQTMYGIRRPWLPIHRYFQCTEVTGQFWNTVTYISNKNLLTV